MWGGSLVGIDNSYYIIRMVEEDERYAKPVM